MDFFALLTDPKVLLIIAVLALLVGLGYYTWRQSAYLEDLKMKNSKMLEQVKHGVLLDGSDDGDDGSGSRRNIARLRLRPDMASNMSEDTRHDAEDEDTGRYDADAEGEGENGVGVDTENQDWEDDCTDEEHNAYIKELIRINDMKRGNSDAYYVKTQQQSGHNGPVYDSGEEEMIFDNYADTADEASDTEMERLAEAELKLAQADLKLARADEAGSNVKAGINVKAGSNVKAKVSGGEDDLVRKINADINQQIDEPLPVIPQVVSIKNSTHAVEPVVKPEPLDNTPKKIPRKKSDAPKAAAKTKAATTPTTPEAAETTPEAAETTPEPSAPTAPLQQEVSATLEAQPEHTPLKIKPLIGKKVQSA